MEDTLEIRSARALVVLGNGMAAYRFCARLAEGGGAAGRRVVVLGEEERAAYDRVHLSDVLAKRAPSELELAPPAWYAERGFEVRLGDPAVHVDLGERCVASRSGLRLRFDELVFATGSSAVVPPVPGADLPEVLTYRTLDDVEAILARAQRALRGTAQVAVVGGGLLGLEVARALQRLGCLVDVFERAAHLLPRQLDAATARVLAGRLRARGMRLELGRTLERLEPSRLGVRLRFATGSAAEAELVVIAAGVRPRDELARAAGLLCHPRGGIEIDDRCRTSAPGVLAIGECARHRDVVYGLAAPCLAMAEVAADGISGRAARFRGVAPATRLKTDVVSVSVVGETDLERPGVVRVSHRGAEGQRSLVLERGLLVGATAVGDWPEWYRVQEAVSRRRRIFAWQQARLARRGSVWWAGSAAPIERWADAAPVCTCLGVDCGTLRRARAEGCETSLALSARTGAGTLCGSCRPLLEALAGERAAAVRESAGRTLLGAGGAAAALVAILAALPAIPLSESVQGFSLDPLWRESALRQLTGFATLAVCLASLAFSLRKRWRRLARFSYDRWRSVHALLGVAALLGLAVHTGFRTGSNLDRALLVSFLGLAALGACAGVVTSLEHRLPAADGARLRRVATAAHVVLFWPFPVLVLFHVLKVYWY